MRILVVGSGGREHALCWKIKKSPLCEKLYCAPGNAGINELANCIDILADDVDRLVQLAQLLQIDLVVVGPEQPLTLGLSDRLTALGVKVFGPSARAARIEGSKGFLKYLCAKYNIPTASYQHFQDADQAKRYVMDHFSQDQESSQPIVIKVDGLAAGKGVVVALNLDMAIKAVEAALVDNSFGSAGDEIIIEQFLEGEEISVFALCDGENVIPFGTAQDHKAVGEGDQGANTGGMGAYSPAKIDFQSHADHKIETMDRIWNDIIIPTVKALKNEGAPYKGVLYAGLMLTSEGPQLIEYNCRFGDPECQVLMMRLIDDIVPSLVACHDGSLNELSLSWHKQSALTVVMASQGYPGGYKKGTVISNIERIEQNDHEIIFHAGTDRDDEGQLLAIGGRVLNVTAMHSSVERAQANAYKMVDQISWSYGFCRRDIGWRAVSGMGH